MHVDEPGRQVTAATVNDRHIGSGGQVGRIAHPEDETVRIHI